jgi:putative tryptophan/tyrosine transport system substrate-binding protein
VFNIGRRAFITLLGGVGAWPLTARAQQPAPVIGFLSPTSPPDHSPERMRAFRQGLKETGYVEGENVTVVYRWADNQLEQLPAMANELIRRQVAVLVTLARGSVVAKAATSTIPIVFTAAEDPVRLGLIASLARPGGNLTGVNLLSAEVVAKRLDLLRELVPAATRLAVLVNPAGTTAETTLSQVAPAARAMGLQVDVLRAGTRPEIDAAFAAMVRNRPDALFVAGDPFFALRRVQLALLAAQHAVPASYGTREVAEVGGLMSYGSNIADAYRQMGVYAGRILKGAKPADLPVIQATKFELVINAQAATMLGINVPATLLSTADEVIE